LANYDIGAGHQAPGASGVAMLEVAQVWMRLANRGEEVADDLIGIAAFQSGAATARDHHTS